jgi:p70 ribosomal S6 kinase/serum/glucocorticoid-regulated kinase 2
MICLLLALEYLHKQKIAHLDIKPENMLIDDKGYFRLCDFNLSHDFSHNNKKIKLSGVGTYGYQAP